MQYVNTSRTNADATFVRVAPLLDGSVVVFKSKKTSISKGQVAATFVAASVRLDQPVSITACETACPVEFTESMNLSFNVRAGTPLTTLKTELLRLVDKAVDDYNLSNGLVPPTHASFES